MRDLIEQLVHLGFALSFSQDSSGHSVIRIHRTDEHGHASGPELWSCILTPGTFHEQAEDAIIEAITELKRAK